MSDENKMSWFSKVIAVLLILGIIIFATYCNNHIMLNDDSFTENPSRQ